MMRKPIREVVCSMLQNASYHCKQAASGVEALAILNDDNNFQLVLTDLMMPEMDGVGLLEAVKDKAQGAAGGHGHRRA